MIKKNLHLCKIAKVLREKPSMIFSPTFFKMKICSFVALDRLLTLNFLYFFQSVIQIQCRKCFRIACKWPHLLKRHNSNLNLLMLSNSSFKTFKRIYELLGDNFPLNLLNYPQYLLKQKKSNEFIASSNTWIHSLIFISIC